MLAQPVDRALTTGPSDRSAVLVVIGGLPGSGKTTLLRRLLTRQAPHVRGVDSEQISLRLRRAGIRLPYRLLRPVVHGWHRGRVVRTVLGGAPVVVLTDPWTSGWWRAAVLQAARFVGRSVRLVLIDTTAAEARSGQRARGRSLSDRRMTRHTVRWAKLLQRATRRGPVDGADRVLIIDRRDAEWLDWAEVLAH